MEHAEPSQDAQEYRRTLFVAIAMAAIAIPSMAIGFYLTYRAIVWMGT